MFLSLGSEHDARRIWRWSYSTGLSLVNVGWDSWLEGKGVIMRRQYVAKLAVKSERSGYGSGSAVAITLFHHIRRLLLRIR